MKIVHEGKRKMIHPWAGKNWECTGCHSVIELGDDDVEHVDKYDDDQRDGESLQLNCPVCLSWQVCVPSESEVARIPAGTSRRA